jgi:adenylate kinase family enzyme
MRKIVVIGSCGAGKSTFSRRLHNITNLELIHLDKHYWEPNWSEPAKDEWKQKVAELVQGDSWIIDGNYGGTMELRIAACDTVIFLDLPRFICLRRVLQRIAFYKKNGRPDMADGCDERFDWEFIKYVWRFQKDKIPQIESRLEKFGDSKKIVRLRSNRDIELFFKKIGEN